MKGESEENVVCHLPCMVYKQQDQDVLEVIEEMATEMQPIKVPFLTQVKINCVAHSKYTIFENFETFVLRMHES